MTSNPDHTAEFEAMRERSNKLAAFTNSPDYLALTRDQQEKVNDCFNATMTWRATLGSRMERYARDVRAEHAMRETYRSLPPGVLAERAFPPSRDTSGDR